MHNRRSFLQVAGAVAAASRLSAPALAQSSRANTLTYVPPAGLLILDPHFTTINQTVYYGHYVYETLYAIDAKYQARPQMVEGHTVSSDNLTWTIKLRPGLKFHDGERVRAKDCVASIKRWGKRDAFGVSLLSFADEVIAVDDDNIRFHLKKPFGILPDALAHPIASPCVIMPERVASQDITTQITESIGSGPMRFVRDEFVPSQRAVFAKNKDYVPRQEAPDHLAGGKIVNFERVEWRTLADQATAAAALQAGEVDWWDSVQPDLVELLKANSQVTVAESDQYRNWLRFNCGVRPFNNPALRRAVAAAVDQTTYTQVLGAGNNPPTCYAMYTCGLPGIDELGKPLMSGAKDLKALAAKVKEAGYAGETIVVISATDVVQTHPMSLVAADMMTKLGMKVEVQSMDINTFVSRRASQAPADQGGWNMFSFLTSSPILANPLTNIVARGLGPKGYPGNNDDPTLEAAITDWIEATSDADRLARLGKVHMRLWDTTPIVPVASYSQYTAFRSDLKGYIRSTVPMPWNIKRS